MRSCGEERSPPVSLIHHLGRSAVCSGLRDRTLWRHCQGFSDPPIITPAALQCGHQRTARGNLEHIKLGFLFNPASKVEGLKDLRRNGQILGVTIWLCS